MTDMTYITIQGDNGADFTEFFVPAEHTQKVKNFLHDLPGVVIEAHDTETITGAIMRLSAEEQANDFPDDEWDATLKKNFGL